MKYYSAINKEHMHHHGWISRTSWPKETKQEKVNTVWYHLQKKTGKTNLVYGDRKKVSCLGPGAWEQFGGGKPVLDCEWADLSKPIKLYM